MTKHSNVIDELIKRHDRYSECEEYHLHEDGDYPREEHENFDDKALKQSLATELVRMMEEALPEKSGHFHSQFYEDGFRQAIDVTRTRLTAIIEREKLN